jgi:MerR family transcriptional regulator/heat shock protein HspR
MYSEADIDRLRQIQRLTQDMGVNLAGVEVILDLLDKMARMQEQIESEMERMHQLMEERDRRMQK